MDAGAVCSAPGVLLASLPVSSSRYPSLALGLLKPAVEALGVRCDVRYFSLDYVDVVGAETAACLSDLDYYSALVGEWVFAGAAHADPPEPLGSEDMRYIQEVFRPKCPKPEFVSRLLLLLAARDSAAAFIDWCVDEIDWSRYRVLGVSTSFQQNMASLALARRVKARHPEILVVFGGANCQGDMGVELHRRYPFIDAVCLGEGDRVFPELLQRHFAGRETRECAPELPGIVLRGADGSTIVPARETEQVEDLDALPFPDLSDFYAQRACLPVASARPAATVFETARGCWWGAKHHCTFCGLNGRMMAYRSKSPSRAYAEVAHLAARYGNNLVNADAILDMRYFEEFLPRLAAEGPEISAFWQMKANLKPEQVTMLAQAGIKRIQPGIEALDTGLLALMNKGCTMLQNVQVLKLAAENGLSVAWNLLFGFPGEDPDAYLRTARIIPKLRHLQPPTSTGRVFADRFSPYFQRPDAYGVRLEPVAAYGFIHPFDDASVRRLAYHFHMRSDELANAHTVAAPMKREQQDWCAHHAESALRTVDHGMFLEVTDARWGWPRAVRRFDGAAATVLRTCWRITALNRLRDTVAQLHPDECLDDVLAKLDRFGLILQEGGDVLGLALREPLPDTTLPLAPSPSARSRADLPAEVQPTAR